MSRFSERVRIASLLSVVLVSCGVLASGCEQLDGRQRARAGNREFRDAHFVDAVADYETALKQVDDPIVHYNLWLAYSKVFRAGFEGPILLGTKDEPVCQALPKAKLVDAGACVKEGDRHFAECGSAKTGPLEKEIAALQEQVKGATDEAKAKDLQATIREKQDQIGRYTCSSSFRCVEGAFCSLTSPEIADLAAQHFQIWINSQPSDESIRTLLKDAVSDRDDAKKAENSGAFSAAQKRVDDLGLKDQTRKQMTALWLDSEQHNKALDYWQGLLKDRPNDPEIMGILAGINLKAGDWRKSIDWYNKVADVTSDVSSKVAQYQFIGNVAWSKLNSRTLAGIEAVELADRGLGALQRAAAAQPKNPIVIRLQVPLFNFRSTAEGASWAAAIDRASGQDLAALARVVTAAQAPAPASASTPAPTSPATPAPAPPVPAASGSTKKSGG